MTNRAVDGKTRFLRACGNGNAPFGASGIVVWTTSDDVPQRTRDNQVPESFGRKHVTSTSARFLPSVVFPGRPDIWARISAAFENRNQWSVR